MNGVFLHSVGTIAEAVDIALAPRPGEGVVKQDGHLQIPCNISPLPSSQKVKEAKPNKNRKWKLWGHNNILDFLSK